MPLESLPYSSIEEKVISAFNSVADKLRSKNERDGRWTLEVKMHLHEDAPADCEVCTTGSGKTEFLHDLTWIKRDSDRGSILDLAMALECEWRMGREIFDFQKLLLARADTRVMVFQGDRQHREGVIAQMREEIQRFAKTPVRKPISLRLLRS